MSRVLFFVDDFCWSKIAELFSQPGSATVWTTLTDLLPEPWKGYLVTILRSGLLVSLPPLLARQRGRRLAATLIVVVCLLGLAVFPLQTAPTDQLFKKDIPLPGHDGNPEQEKIRDWGRTDPEHARAEEEFRRKQEDDKARRAHEIEMTKLDLEAEREKEDSRRRHEEDKLRQEHEQEMRQLDQAQKREEEHRREEREKEEQKRNEDKKRKEE